MTVRTFDWKPLTVRDPRDWTVHELLSSTPHESQYDKLLDARITSLAARVAVLEGKTPPAPVPVPPSPTPVPSGAVHWTIPICLDQEAEGECVGHGWAHAIAGNPKPLSIGNVTKQNPLAEHLYERAQHFDGSPPDEQSGASVDGGAKAAIESGDIAAYHSAGSSITAVAQAVVKFGPVVLGIPWLQSMFDPDPATNVLLVDENSGVAGGHCLVANGYDPATDLFTLHNSWGASWAVNGEAQIHAASLGWLLAQQGEAVLPTKA